MISSARARRCVSWPFSCFSLRTSSKSFSATIESSVKKLVEAHVRNPVRIELGCITKPSEQVDLHFYEVEQDRKFGLLEMMLTDEQGSFLVFARTKHGAEKLAKKLSQSGFKCAAIHGDRS